MLIVNSRTFSGEPVDDHEALERENAEAEAAMKSFAAITGTDEIYAQTILQDVNWSVEVRFAYFPLVVSSRGLWLTLR